MKVLTIWNGEYFNLVGYPNRWQVVESTMVIRVLGTIEVSR